MIPRLSVLVFACLFISACANSSPSTGAHPVSASPATAAAPTTATPAPSSCRLPVASDDAPVDGRLADGASGRGGFVTFPGGTFAADSTSLGSYDRAHTKWLPVLRDRISPDGNRYAWGEYRTDSGPTTGIIHVVDAGTGADHTVLVPAPSMVVSYETDGIYVARVVPNSGAPPQGLTLVDPTGAGTFRQIVADGTWTYIGGGFAFGADLDPSIPELAGVGGPGRANRVRKMDVQTGAISVVSTSPSAQSTILGVSPATPVVSVETATSYKVVIGGTTLFSAGPSDGNPRGPIVVDGSTIWFSSLSGAVWRWDGSGPAAQVATVPLKGVQVAGACR